MRYSQLQLSLELDISAKHISFMETGRSTPSREMIVRIGEFLGLPKREINRALYSAGYSPVYTELSIDDERLKPVINAIEQMIDNHMPYPAIVMNQKWDVVKVNESAKSLMSELGFSGHKNLIEFLVQDSPEESRISNWNVAVQAVLVRLRDEISRAGEAGGLEDLERRLNSCLSEDSEPGLGNDNQPFLPIVFRVYDRELSFFSVISQLSTIQDITVSEFKVELMFPSDEITKAFYNSETTRQLVSP